MKRTFELLSALVVVSFAGLQLVAAQAPEEPKPGPEHERLGYFVGKWTSEGEMKPGPMGPGGKMTSTDTCEWFDGRFAVVCRSEGKTPMGPSKSVGILGYSAEEKVYTYYGIDNSNMTMTTVPRGTGQGDTWTYTDESMMGGKKYQLPAPGRSAPHSCLRPWRGRCGASVVSGGIACQHSRCARWFVCSARKRVSVDPWTSCFTRISMCP